MRRFFAVFAVAVTALVAGVTLSRPEVLKAAVNFSGFTHLLVREPKVKQLSAEFSNQPCNFTTPVFERNRDGSLSAIPYTVPPGRVFVVTDVQVSLVGDLIARFNGAVIRANGQNRFRFDSVNDETVRIWHGTGGILFDAGTAIDFFVSACPGPVDGTVDVFGYETDDQP